MNKTLLPQSPTQDARAHCVLGLMRRLRGMPDGRYLQCLVAYHAAPTIQGIKPATLIRLCDRRRDFASAVGHCAAAMRSVFRLEITCCPNAAGDKLLLIYRPDMVSGVIAEKEAAALLADAGYEDEAASGCLEAILAKLARKCSRRQFPHEIGVLLGYPAKDVRQFMCGMPRGGDTGGCWRSRSAAEHSRMCRNRYRQAKLRAAEMIIEGASMEEIAGELCPAEFRPSLPLAG